MYRPVEQIVSMNQLVMMSFQSNESLLFKFDEGQQDLAYIKTDTLFEHEDKVMCLECFPEKGMFISGGLDGYVKIWNVKKELIREIKFPEPVYSVSFLNKDADLIVGHMGKISTVSVHDYQPYEIKKLYQP